MESLVKIASLVATKKYNKERFETILEPLQAMIQLALLSYCPIYSKLSISNNILILQIPSWTQSLVRKYNNDCRDDLYFLFTIIKRFHKFYLQNTSTNPLYDILITHSIKGIDKLIETYQCTNDNHNATLVHTLRMYKNLLANPNLLYNDSDNLDIKLENDSNNSNDSIDNIFIKIVDLYNDTHKDVFKNIFHLLEKSPENYEIYIKAIHILMKPTNNMIRKWINDNIIF